MKIVLSKRLSAVASCLSGRVIADVGCDSANLAIWLALNRDVFTYACDLRIGPLKKARINLKKYGVESRVKLIQSNGLEKVPRCVDEVVISGLGGLLIEKIVLGCSWLKELNIPIVLQPQSFSIRLKKKLALHGFEVLREVFVVEKDKLYRIILLKFTGVRKILSLKQAIVSNLNISCGQIRTFLKLKQQQSRQVLNFLANAGSEQSNLQKRFYYEKKCEVLGDLLQELEL